MKWRNRLFYLVVLAITCLWFYQYAWNSENISLKPEHLKLYIEMPRRAKVVLSNSISTQNSKKEPFEPRRESKSASAPAIPPDEHVKDKNTKNRLLVSTERELKPSTSTKFYLLVMLSLSNGHHYSGYQNYSKEELLARDQEYMSVLNHNLNHRSVQEIHLFYRSTESLQIVQNQNYTQKKKLVFIQKESGMNMSDFFLYSSRNLMDKPVIALNGDIMLGEGFHRINTERMRDEKVMYSLSRYNLIEAGLPCEPKNMRLPKGYLVSHDTHIFRLAEPLNETLILDKLDYPINMWGAENAMIWTFKYTLKWTVRNPCKVLSTYHKHCSRVHGPSLKDIGKSKYSILYLPGKNWTKTHFRQSIVRYENKLAYSP